MNNLWQWVIVGAVSLLAGALLLLTLPGELKKLDECRQVRIGGFNQSYFSWDGIQKLGTEGKYQPKCL